jgi:hypothetical protein|tara:strand:- start:22 stop:225 length:204 start_codon:yes stop_codon:yes gene_type:complete
MAKKGFKNFDLKARKMAKEKRTKKFFDKRTIFDLLEGTTRLGKNKFMLPFNKGGIVANTQSKFKGHY